MSINSASFSTGVNIIHVRTIDESGNEVALGHLSPSLPTDEGRRWVFADYSPVPGESNPASYLTLSDALSGLENVHPGAIFRAELPSYFGGTWGCDDCGIEYPVTHPCNEVDGGDYRYCNWCLSDNAERCADCEEHFSTHTLFDTSDVSGYTRNVCEDCWDNYFVCDSCNTVEHSDENVVDGLCSSCAVMCDACRSYCNPDESHSGDHVTICDSCYYDSYFTCENCSDVRHVDQSQGDGLCEDCGPDDTIPDEYRYPGCFQTFGDPAKGQRLFGWELEVESHSGDFREQLDTIMDRLGDYGYLQEEVSIRSPGVEITSHAATLNYTRGKILDLLNDPIPGLRSWDTTSGHKPHGRCGLHIHVSRSALSNLQIGKILVFVNDPDHREFITKLAGRDCSRFAEIKHKRLTDGRIIGSHKFDAVATHKVKTIEFRIFRGSLRLTTVLKNLEFVDAVCAFTAQASCRGLSLAEFLAFVGKTPKVWPSLSVWLRRNGYLPQTARQPAKMATAQA